MALDKLVDSAKLNACLDAEADAIRAKTGGSSELPFDYANNKGFADAIAAIPSGGGTTLTDGIVIVSRDSNDRPTAIDLYGPLWENALSYDGVYYHNTIGWSQVETVRLKTNQKNLSKRCFYGMVSLSEIVGIDVIETISAYCLNMTKLTEINMPLVTAINVDRPFSGMTALKTVNLPYVSGKLTAGTYPLFEGDTALETVTIGSIGHGVYNNVSINAFKSCTQAGLTIVIFVRSGSDVDALVTAIRNGATNATIVIKASESTTYNGTSYAAGDTILTSEVT